MKIVEPDAKGLEAAAEAVRGGLVVAYPTETVYGLGVSPFDEMALDRLFDVKGRERGNPVLLIISGFCEIEEVVQDISPLARAFAEAFWPGPLSLLLPKAPGLPEAVTAGSGKVCVRCPACSVARGLCKAVGHAITSTSANLSGQTPACQAEDCLLPGVSMVLDGGKLGGDAVSTVYDPDEGRVLREGAISRNELERVREGMS